MLLSCRALTVSVLAAVLLVSSLATTAAAAPVPSFSVTWDVHFEPGFWAVSPLSVFQGDSQAVAFQTYEQLTVSNDFNNILIATTANQSLWRLQSSGPLQSNIAVYAFSAIPKLIFVLFNNMQQPNISAVIPTTGTVVWSTLCPFNVTQWPSSQTVSADGAVLYWFTVNDAPTDGLTALDAEYGTTLWSESVSYYNPAQPLQCGPPHPNCLGVFVAGSPTIQFLDGRTGAVLSEVSLPGNTAQASRIISLSQATPDVVLVLGYYENVAINTTSFTVLSSWSVPVASGENPHTLIQPMPPRSPTRLAVITTVRFAGIAAADLFTGSSLWTTNGTALCPCPNPRTGCAGTNSQLILPKAPFDAAGEVIAFEANCYYPNDYDPISIVGLLNLTTGALVKSEVTYTFSNGIPENTLAQIGSECFYAESAFYDTNLTVFAVYPPAHSPCYAEAAVRGNTATFTVFTSSGCGGVVGGRVNGCGRWN